MHSAQSLINHVAFVYDASYSMKNLERKVVQVADAQIRQLAEKSKELNQETRVSIYRFGEKTIECLLFDMDVARLPSMDGLYKVLYENTALLDATLKSQDDLATTSVLYGDHAFLTFVLTDGAENASRTSRAEFGRRLRTMDENWSIGFLVPNRQGRDYLRQFGVLDDSIALWDTTSSAGMDEVHKTVQAATTSFMTNRAKGVRGTRSVFSTGKDAVNKTTIAKALEPLDSDKYTVYRVDSAQQIRDFVEAQGRKYVAGKAYYPLTKSETIQARKQLAVFEKGTGKVFVGDEARHLVGLPDGESARVRPDANTFYDVYVQSTSVNRKLVPGTKLLVLN